LTQNAPKSVQRPGSAQTRWGLKRSSRPLATVKGRGMIGKKKMRKGKGKGQGKRKEGEGKEGKKKEGRGKGGGERGSV